jgi:endonuclease/exonuclease/phosphatase family metal-dependent hydrolase
LLHRRLALALVAVLCLVAAPAAQAKSKPSKLTVMTRNIYLGGNIFLPVVTKDRAEFEAKAGELWDQVNATNFPKRSKLLVREIKKQKPDMIGLQEVALWRRGPTGVKDGATTPATQVVYDFLKTLRADLKKAGLKYRVGDTQRETDIEASIDKGYDVRLTMSDVILVKVRKGLKVRKRSSKNYKSKITVPTNGGPFTSQRGWTAVDASLDGRKFRFLNTHLEAFAATQRQAQAQELIAKGGPATKSGRVILVGDLNSDRDGLDDGDPVPYKTLTSFGFKDGWVAGGGKGFSCCFKSPLIRDAPPAPFDHRIDHILVKPKTKASKARVLGRDPKNRAGTLWPSDHGGAVVTFTLK